MLDSDFLCASQICGWVAVVELFMGLLRFDAWEKI